MRTWVCSWGKWPHGSWYHWIRWPHPALSEAFCGPRWFAGTLPRSPPTASSAVWHVCLPYPPVKEKHFSGQVNILVHSSIVNYKILFLLNLGMILKLYMKNIGKEKSEYSCCMANLVFILFCLFSFIFHLGHKILQLLILLANCLCCVLLFSALERNISYKQAAPNKMKWWYDDI